MHTFSRRWVLTVTVLCCLSTAIPPAVAGGSGAEIGTRAGQPAPDDPCVGTVTEPANGTTVVSVQGMRFGSEGGKRPAKLVGVGPRGEIRWVHQSAEELDAVWGYDVDPMANGHVFVTATVRGHETVVYEFDPAAQQRVWTERFDLADTHDADLIEGGEEILVANMRNYNETTDENEDRIFVYNRTTEEIEWEWHFDDHYDRDDVAENYTDDWTHVNDVDEVGEGLYLASPRNFDQAIVVNRSTGEIELKLGADQNHDVLDEQHNPDYLESENGTPTLLVGDSENDRIVEYANRGRDPTDGDGWTRTWSLTGDLNWPRDADRLADGDTLVTDSASHRVAEVTPEGEVVWEFYAPWLIYDAARLSQTNESGGPTMADLNATGAREIDGGEGRHENASALEACHRRLENVTGWAEDQTPTETDARTTESALDEADADARTAESETEGATSSVPGFGPVAALSGVATALALAVGRRRGR
ncbi:PGF-CTERM sorting domain-containing protein [Halorussus marinus]|uniref:PGF-CTERM sorting domain-containing protein n=1 Tax=Halorussus marinus TaxID=2505976 RepID=UPI001091CBB8|nr:PGF-CTERM sorting domain-containing protein [Halorussus marinus]